MKITITPRIVRHPGGIASVQFEARQPVAIVESLSFSSTGTVVVQVKNPLSDRVLWFGLGFLISRELSRDITLIRIQPTLKTTTTCGDVIPADVFSELELLCGDAKNFFTHVAARHWNCSERDCIVKRGTVLWSFKSLSIGFDDLVDLAAEKEFPAKCA